MPNKQEIKTSEARILIFLNQTPARFHYAGAIAVKLKIDYSYCLHILKVMHEQGWIRKEIQAVKLYYFNTRKAPVKKAKRLLR